MYQKAVLDNGLRILTVSLPHTRSVSFGFFIGAGSRYEADEMAGISHFMEHMFFKGTERRPTARDIAVAIEGIGGMFNGGTGREATTYWVKVAHYHLSTAVDVLTDMLLHSKFQGDEVEKERRVIIEEINMTLDTPQELVHLLANDLTWPAHPLGRDVAGTKESVGKMSREDILSYLAMHYTPPNTVLSVAGNIEHSAVIDEIAKSLGSWEAAGEASFLPAPEEQSAPRMRLEYKETEQAHLCLNLRGLARRHPDRYALNVLNTVLGEGMSSRLFQEIREKRGLAYSIYSYVSFLRDTGKSGVYAGVTPERLEQALKAILAEWEKLQQTEVSAEELGRAKEFTKGRILLMMEDTSSVSSWFGNQELLTPEEVLTPDGVVEKIDAVTASDVQRVAQKLFDVRKLNLAVVGPFEDEDSLKASLSL